MFGYEDIQISLALPALYLLPALILIAAYSFYVYRFTVPDVNKSKKFLLTSLRTLALLSLCLIFFEPVLNLSRKLVLEPKNLVFIDNSRSLTIEDGTNRISTVGKILTALSARASSENLVFYKFGNDVSEISADSLNKIDFSDGITNFQEIFRYVSNSNFNIASISLITDGVITSGSNPYYEAINLGIPVFTIGIGDTTQRKDVEIKKILYNDFIYAETPTSIITTIFNKGYAGEFVTIRLYEDNKFYSQQTIILSSSGIQNVSFDYIARSSGDKKLSIEILPLKDEFTPANNKQIFYVKILTNKIKVLLLASSPSADLTFIKNALRRDDNVEIKTMVQISGDRFLDKLNYQHIDSADVLFLIGFPSDATSEEIFNRVLTKIRDNKTPYFLTLSSGVSLNKLTKLGNELPFTITQNFTGTREVQPSISQDQLNNPIIQTSDKNSFEQWNDLPPVFQPNAIFNPRIESRTLAQIKVNNNVMNSPLILSGNFSGRRSVAVLAKDIWKWKLQTVPKRLDLFDSFIINSLRWLKAGEEQKLVKIKTSKRSFSQGERIEFIGEVFDESLNPVSEARVKIIVSSDNDKVETDMQNVGPGLYEGSIVINKPGDYNFTAEASLDKIVLGKDDGSFNVGEIDIEMINPVMNYSFLNLLSKDTGGEFFFNNDFSSLPGILNELKNNLSGERIVTAEIFLWSNTWMLITAIFLFSLEWFIRKRSGML